MKTKIIVGGKKGEMKLAVASVNFLEE